MGAFGQGASQQTETVRLSSPCQHAILRRTRSDPRMDRSQPCAVFVEDGVRKQDEEVPACSLKVVLRARFRLAGARAVVAMAPSFLLPGSSVAEETKARPPFPTLRAWRK